MIAVTIVFDAAANQLRVELMESGDVVTFRFDGAIGPANALRFLDEEWRRVAP